MKAFISVAIIVVLLVLMQDTSSFLLNRNRVVTKVCTISATCATTTPVCARITGTNTCVNFRNLCRLSDANCIRNNIYTQVVATACANIALGASGACVGLPLVSTATNTNPLNGLFGNKLNNSALFG